MSRRGSFLHGFLTRSAAMRGSSEDAFSALEDINAPPPVEPETYQSQALQMWWQVLEKGAGHRRRVLDLGPLHASTFQALGEHGVDLSVAGVTGLPIWAQLGDFDWPDQVTAVLAWDCLNYCEDNEIRLLGRHLAQRLPGNGPVLLSLETRAPYVGLPSSHRIAGPGMVRREPPFPLPSARDRLLTPAHLSKLWPDFRMLRSFVLRDGRQELVYVRAARA